MSSIEYIVRPYQSPNPHGSIIIPATPLGTRARATLTWGAKATMPEAKAPDQQGASFNCCSENINELDRVSETVRISSPDGESYVDVARARSLRVKKNEKNNCASDWNQQIETDHPWIDFAEDSMLGFDSDSKSSGNCGGTWNFTN